MRKLQNIISTIGIQIVRQGKSLIVRNEAACSRCARNWSALSSDASLLVSKLVRDAWQGLCFTWRYQPVGTVHCFVTVVTKQHQRRHIAMCHRAAA